MSEIHRILDQMDRAFSGDAWHGPSLMSVLDGVSAEDASKHPIRGAHSIWELVHHIGAWNTISQHRLGGRNGGNHARARLASRLGSQRDGLEARDRESEVESHARLRESVKDSATNFSSGKAAGTGLLMLRGPSRRDPARPLPRRTNRHPEKGSRMREHARCS